MKLKKRLIAMFMSILMITGMIMGSTVTTLAAIVPDTPVTIARINVEKYLYATGEGATVPESLTSFSWTLKKVSYQPASTQVTGTVEEVMAPRGTTTSTVEPDSTTDPVTDYTASITIDYPRTDGTIADRTYKTGSGIIEIPIVSAEGAGHTKAGVYTYSIQEMPVADNGITYDPDIYYINIYVVNVVDNANDNEPTGATTIANITSWKGVNKSPDGNTPDVSAGDHVHGVTYIPNGTESPTPAAPATPATVTTNVTPGEDWNTENADSATGNSDTEGKTAITSTPDKDADGKSLGTMTIAYPFTNAMDTRDLIVSKDAKGDYATTAATFKVKVTDNAKGPAETFEVRYYRIQQTGPDQLLTQEQADILIGGYQTAATVLDPTNVNYHADTVPDTIVNDTETDLLLMPGFTFRIVGLSNQTSYSVAETADYAIQSRTATAGHRDGETGIVSKGTSDGTTTTTTYTTAEETAANNTTALPAMEGTMISKGIYGPTGGTGAEADPYTYSSGVSTTNQVVAPGTFEDVQINYVNTRNLVTPTGIVLNMLPYIVAVVAVIVAGVLFVVIRKKRTKKGAGL